MFQLAVEGNEVVSLQLKRAREKVPPGLEGKDKKAQKRAFFDDAERKFSENANKLVRQVRCGDLQTVASKGLCLRVLSFICAAETELLQQIQGVAAKLLNVNTAAQDASTAGRSVSLFPVAWL